MNAPQAHSGFSAIDNLIRHSLVPALLLDSNLLILQLNQAMAGLLNRAPATLIGAGLFSLLSGVGADAKAKELCELVERSQSLLSKETTPAYIQLGDPAFEAEITVIAAEFGGLFGFLVQSKARTPPSPALDWEAALEGAGQGVWDYDIRTGIKYYSKTWYDMRGLPNRHVRGADEVDWFSKIHPDDLDLTQQFTSDLEAGLLKDVHFEYRERHSLGHWLWIMCRGRPIAWDVAGNPTRYVGTDTDISAIKSAQATVSQLTNDEIRWKNAQESTEQGLWDIDMVSGQNFLSPQWFHMRGLSETDTGESAFENWIGRVHPDDLQNVKYEIERQEKSDEDITKLEYRERHQDGRWIWILSRGKVVRRDANGRAARNVGTDTDITDIKASEERVRRISRRLELAMAASKVGVWEFDLTTNDVEWDAAMREMYGLPTDNSPLPHNIWERSLHPEDREGIIARTIAAHGAKDDYDLDYRIVREDGTVRHIRSRASYIDDGFDGPKLLGLNWDVTQDIQLAHDLKVANAIALKHNSQLEAARALMEYSSLHDALTGLANRRMLDQVQQASVDNPAARNKRFAVLHVDLDRFKQINDTLGHAAGDAVLIRTASVLRQTVGANDLVARVGGDEFAVFIEDAPEEEVLVALARQIISRSAMPMKYMHHDCRCGVSIGIAYANGSDIEGNDLFINADMAMYRSKNSGRGGCTVFNDDMKREALEKKSRSDELLTGLDQNEFFCLYQPQYRSDTLELAGIEALVRWNNPVHGVMTPGEFLPLAEELQIIDRIDKAVLQLALADLAIWQSAGLYVPRLSINISGRRLRDPELAFELMRAPIPSGVLSFEFLESIFLDEPDEIQVTNIACIRALGIGIEVDDFGSGHSSIVSLLKLKPDRLKIDRSIVEPVTRSDKQRHLVQSIVDIGNLQGIKVLAEGVETAEHVKILQSIGCDELQGYALSYPVSALELAELLYPNRRLT